MFAIEAEGLVKTFPGGVRALDEVSFSVAPGRVLGLLGPNGAGKTTAIHVLATLLAPDGGRARVLGADVVADPFVVRRSIGFAGQFAAVDDNLTARENLIMVARLLHLPARERNPRVDELLEAFGLTEDASRLVRTYSGGLRRRLDLATALVHRPPVLFLDEPTTGLDPVGRMALWNTVRSLVDDGVAVLLTTQYLEEAEYLADDLTVLAGGRVVAAGTVRELRAQLGRRVLALSYLDQQAATRGAAALEAGGFGTKRPDPLLVEVDLPEGTGSSIAALRVLDDEALVPDTFEVRDPSLTDVFVAVTSGSERAGGAAADRRPLEVNAR